MEPWRPESWVEKAIETRIVTGTLQMSYTERYMYVCVYVFAGVMKGAEEKESQRERDLPPTDSFPQMVAIATSRPG